MVTIVLDNTKSLDNSDIYQPLLYRSMRHEQCFYMKYDEQNRINKIKSIVKYYPELDYEIVVLLDLTKIGESLLEKVYSINTEIISKVFVDVKRAVKIRYIVLDYINGNYIKEEQEFLKNIDYIEDDSMLLYLNSINKSCEYITWTRAIDNIDSVNIKNIFIDKVLPFAEVDIITLNKLPNEEKETFFRDIYLKIYGFIDLIAEGIIQEDTTNCCYKELPIYKLNIDLNYDAIEETAKRYLLNLENEEKKLDMNSFEKIEQVPLFDSNESNENEYEKIINQMNSTKLNLKVPRITLFRHKRDLKTLENYINSAKLEYKNKLKRVKSMYGIECRDVRDDLNKDFNSLKMVTKERFEVENKIKEEQSKIEKLKYQKTKPLIYDLEEQQQYDEFLKEQKDKLFNVINSRKIVLESFWKQCIFVLVYIFLLFILLNTINILKEDLIKYAKNIVAIVCAIWLFAWIILFSIHRMNIKKGYKKFIREFEVLFTKITEQQRNGVKSIQLTRQLIKSKKKIGYLNNLLGKANQKIENVNIHKYMMQDYKNFAKLIMGNNVLDGSVGIKDLDSTYELDVDIMQKYKNKSYSFLDYVVNNKYKLSLKNASTSRVEKKENAETYIAYVSIE